MKANSNRSKQSLTSPFSPLPPVKNQSRRNFIKRGALCLPTIFIPRLIRAQTILTANGLASFGTSAPAGGGGGCTPSYANRGGTGNRSATSIILIYASSGFPTSPNWINGDTTTNGQFFLPGVTLNGTQFIQFDFGAGNAALVTEAKFYQQTNANQGTWKWQGNTSGAGAGGTSGTDIGSSFTLGGVITQTITTLSANTNSYRSYQLVGVSGSSNAGPWVYEMEFKICGL
jgi:hypothetical protein